MYLRCWISYCRSLVLQQVIICIIDKSIYYFSINWPLLSVLNVKNNDKLRQAALPLKYLLYLTNNSVSKNIQFTMMWDRSSTSSHKRSLTWKLISSSTLSLYIVYIFCICTVLYITPLLCKASVTISVKTLLGKTWMSLSLTLYCVYLVRAWMKTITTFTGVNYINSSCLPACNQK